METYNTIYADPPWKTTAGVALGGYKIVDGKQIWNRDGNTKSRPLSYPTMSVEDIAAMPIKDISSKDAHLYIWVTNSHLPFVFEIIESWGFKYSTALVWAKNNGGLGGAFKISTEFLLFCRRGTLKTNTVTRGTWFNVKRAYKNGFPCHSRKPDFFQELIEKTSPGPYLELFARREREGWDSHGNEIENSVAF